MYTEEEKDDIVDTSKEHTHISFAREQAGMTNREEKKLEEEIKRIPQLNPEDLKNRFSFHPAIAEETKLAHSRIRSFCHHLAKEINDTVPDGREKALALTKLEEVMMWANAGIARNG